MKKILLPVLILAMTFCSGEKRDPIKVPGIVEGDIITVKSLVAGKIAEIGFTEGDSVATEQLLISINSAKIENQIAELTITQKEVLLNLEKMKKQLELINITRAFLQKQVERFKRLQSKKSVSGEKLEEMELKLAESNTSRHSTRQMIAALLVQNEKIENKKKYLQLVINDHRVHSPVEGIVLEKFVSPGENVFPGVPLLDLLDKNSLYLEVFVEEEEMARLKLNQKARILVDGITDRELSGRISFFGRKAEFSPKYVISEQERKSLLYKVKISLEHDVDLFKIGMPVTVILN